jgi:plasmid stability protein
MERISFEIERQDIAEALQADAAAHGRTIADEVAALVEQTYAEKAARPKPADDNNWVAELVELGKKIGLENGIEEFIPKRTLENYVPPKL